MPARQSKSHRAHRLADDQADDLCGRRAQGEADADLVRPLRDEVRDHAVDADGRQHQRHQSERADQCV